MGIGVLLTAIIMGVALGGNNTKMSDAEVIKRARQLGMVDASGTLSSYSEATKGAEENNSDEIASGEKLSEEGKEVPEEVNEGQSETDKSVPEVDEEKKESAQIGESSESVEAEADITLASTQVEDTTSSETAKEETDNGVKTQQVTKTEEPQTQPETQQNEQTAPETTEANNQQEAAPRTENQTEQPAADTAQQEQAASENTEVNNQQEATPQNENQTEQPAAENAQPEVQTQPETSSDVNYIVVVIPGGSESDTCARILREAGVIADGVDFNNYLVRSGLDRKIRSGTKQIPKGSSYEQIASIITR